MLITNEDAGLCIGMRRRKRAHIGRFGCARRPGTAPNLPGRADRRIHPYRLSRPGAMPSGHRFQVLEGRTEPYGLREMFTRGARPGEPSGGSRPLTAGRFLSSPAMTGCAAATYRIRLLTEFILRYGLTLITSEPHWSSLDRIRRGQDHDHPDPGHADQARRWPPGARARRTRGPYAVRSKISLTGQFATVDASLSGRENLMLQARLLGLSRRAARSARTRRSLRTGGISWTIRSKTSAATSSVRGPSDSGALPPRAAGSITPARSSGIPPRRC